MSPTARSLAYLRALGYQAAVVERYLHQIQRKVDLFAIADLIACHPRERQIVLIQTTTASHLGDRSKRVKGQPELAVWLQSGGRFELHGWELRGKRWQVRRIEIQGNELQDVPLTPKPPRRRRKPVQPDLFSNLQDGSAGP